MSKVTEPVVIRGSTSDELERDLARFHDELRREFAKYHQREFRDHRTVGWFIRWLMTDEPSGIGICPTTKSNVRAIARR
jgi:hypothetical protein